MKRYSRIPKTTNINPNVATEGVEYYQTNTYPEISPKESDIYVECDFGDRLDLLANQFYNDTSLYWIIAAANPDKVDFGSLFVTPGTQLRIPQELSEIFGSYTSINE